MKTSAIVWTAIAGAVVVGGVVLLTGAGGPEAVTIRLHEQNGSDQSGYAEIEDVDGVARVTVNVNLGPSGGVEQPAHIHLGSCTDIGAVAYPLNNVAEGMSVTTLNVSTNEIMNSLPLALNVHKSVAESDIYVACGDLGGSAMKEEKKDRDSDSANDLSAALSGSGSIRCEYADKATNTDVVVQIKNGKIRTDGVSQDVKLHAIYMDSKMYFWTDQFAQGFVHTTESIQANPQGQQMLSKAELAKHGTECRVVDIADAVFQLPNIPFTNVGALLP